MKRYLFLAGLFPLISCAPATTDQIQIGTYQFDASILTPAPTLEIGDGGFLSNSPCSAPCFFDIYPGITTAGEIPKYLEKYNFIKDCKMYDDYDVITETHIAGWDCSNFGINYSQNTNIVDLVKFRPGHVLLQDVINKYGIPNIIAVSGPDLPESPSVGATLYYLDIRTILYLAGEQEGVQYTISPTTLISNIVYTDANRFEQSLQFSSWNVVVPWNGYGKYPANP